MVNPAVKRLHTMFSLIPTNSEVHKPDCWFIGRALLAHGVSKVAEGLCADQETLPQFDASTPQDQFVTEGGRTVGLNETSGARPRSGGQIISRARAKTNHNLYPLFRGKGATVTEDGER